jgi:hypothetical protein
MTEDYLEKMAMELDLGDEPLTDLTEEDLEFLFRTHQMACYGEEV